jgi:hypothetical protein
VKGFNGIYVLSGLFLGAFQNGGKNYQLLLVCLSAWKNSAPNTRIFVKILYWNIFGNSVEKMNVHMSVRRKYISK